jgi:hypothetical protein
MLGPAPAEKKADAPDQGALLHGENYFRSEVSKLDCVQGPLPRNEIHKGVEVAREIGKGSRDQDKVFEVTSNKVGTRLNRDLQTSQVLCSKRLTRSSKGLSGNVSPYFP